MLQDHIPKKSHQTDEADEKTNQLLRTVP